MQEVLDSSRYVMGHAPDVSINYSAAVQLSSELERPAQNWSAHEPFPKSKLSAHDEAMLKLVYNSVNFCFWPTPKWTFQSNGNSLDGSWAVLAALHRAQTAGIPVIDPSYLACMTSEQYFAIFPGEPALALSAQRMKCLHELGANMLNLYDGKIENVLQEANMSAPRIARQLTKSFPSFYDASFYRGKEVFFHKRAQLAAADIAQLVPLTETDGLTAFADYKIPQVLRNKNVISYSLQLALAVDSLTPIAQGSAEEIQIRAGQVVAVDLLHRLTGFSAVDIDMILWLMGQKKSPADKPYHRTMGIAY